MLEYPKYPFAPTGEYLYADFVRFGWCYLHLLHGQGFPWFPRHCRSALDDLKIGGKYQW